MLHTVAFAARRSFTNCKHILTLFTTFAQFFAVAKAESYGNWTFESRMFDQTNRTVITIGAIVPMSGGWVANGMLTAAEFALADINANPNVLPDYELRMVYGDSKVNNYIFSRRRFCEADPFKGNPQDRITK